MEIQNGLGWRSVPGRKLPVTWRWIIMTRWRERRLDTPSRHQEEYPTDSLSIKQDMVTPQNMTSINTHCHSSCCNKTVPSLWGEGRRYTYIPYLVTSLPAVHMSISTPFMCIYCRSCCKYTGAHQRETSHVCMYTYTACHSESTCRTTSSLNRTFG